MTANADNPDAVGGHRHPYGPCHHTKYEGCPPCVHSAWDEGVQAARDAVAAALEAGLANSSDGALYYFELDEDDPSCGHDVTFHKDSLLAAIDALRGES